MERKKVLKDRSQEKLPKNILLHLLKISHFQRRLPGEEKISPTYWQIVRKFLVTEPADIRKLNVSEATPHWKHKVCGTISFSHLCSLVR